MHDTGTPPRLDSGQGGADIASKPKTADDASVQVP